MKQFVIVVAGGKGLRMGSEIPKQFLELNGKAVILHTLEKFKEALPSARLLLVLPESEISRWKDISKGTTFENIEIAFGGANRFESVKSGLNLIGEEGVVGIHDSVRPFVTVETIQAVFSAAEASGASIPVVAVKDSLRKVKSSHSESVNRDEYRIVQTPQCFESALIKKAYLQAYNEGFTDDASVVEADGVEPSLVQGNYTNIKITTVEDLRFGEFLLNAANE